jgi:hypothetical protein
VIYPYWTGDTWVFDDPRHDLVQEPFVEGVPRMLERKLEIEHISLESARSGFKAKFSAEPFEGATRWEWHTHEGGGNWYYWPEEDLKGWLCPQLYRYFKDAPRHLYVGASKVNSN